MNSHDMLLEGYELSRTSTQSTKDQEAFFLHDERDNFQPSRFPGQDALKQAFQFCVPSTRAWFWIQHYPGHALARVKRLILCHVGLSRSFFRRAALIACTSLSAIVIVVIITAIFFPHYTRLPPHYEMLRERALVSEYPGRGNLQSQRVFIAASIYDKDGTDGSLAGGPWAQNVLDLIQLLGPKNCFLSIYMNDSGPAAKKALEGLEKRISCDHELVFEEHMETNNLPHVKAPDGSERLKRIAYLAEVRNRALKPLDHLNTTFDRLLILNDVFFHPVDAAQLLFSTNITPEGSTDYRAACAVDFINPFKFYDTFATRDIEGYEIGLPFFPWFSANGGKQSHRAMLKGADAVPVKSCWGGMVAFDARFFHRRHGIHDEPETAGQRSPDHLSVPYRFRAEKEAYWDASESCLVHADIQSPEPGNSGIYVNPFIRVAYDPRTLSLLSLTRRFERLYTPIHTMLDTLMRLPRSNPRRHEEPGKRVEDRIWVADQSGGSFQDVVRITTHTGFCGIRTLQVMKLNMAEGEDNWEPLPVPS
ncbi:uncharacterized protein PV06_11408 [Exophiala oligosperma]|uniref:Glycosyltransferase family 69 protein n=1 Tax=Exophiala oligosperma TaxID=215243 RepID=A0A0D2A7I8_9EURO|nr:uncharacterized protein PV06_11408 [Exophiala oligosperma]KIW36306.1 hypothetical protein PV06_11408 [Exophiala oligosperma]